MNTLKFLEDYLQDQADIILISNGQIIHKGPAAAAKYWLLKYSKIISVSGMVDNRYLSIEIKELPREEVEEIEF